MIGFGHGMPPRLVAVHGPPNFAPAALLERQAFTLRRGDILLIVEHDDGTDEWIEPSLLPLSASGSPPRFMCRS